MRVWFVSIYHCWLRSYAAYMGRVVWWLLPLPNGTGYVFLCVGLSACLWATLRKKRVNGFLWNFQDGSCMEQGTFWNIFGMTPPRLARLFHIPQIRCGGGLRSRVASCYWDCHSCMLAFHSYLSGSFCSSVADIWNMQKTTSKWIDQLHKSHYGLVPPLCTISHNAPICNRNVHMVLYKMVHCEIFA